MTRIDRLKFALVLALLVGVPTFIWAYQVFIDSMSSVHDAAAILSAAAPVGIVVVAFYFILPFGTAAAIVGTVFVLTYLVLGVMAGDPPAAYLLVREEPITLAEWTSFIGSDHGLRVDHAGHVLADGALGDPISATFTVSGIRLSSGCEEAFKLARKLSKRLGGYVQQVARTEP